MLTDLTELMLSARSLSKRAKERRMPATHRQARHVAQQLDAARTCLVQEGPEYLATAEAVLEASADRLAAHAVWIGKCASRGRVEG